ncbi:MAG: hypothetical protein QF669_08425 [Candidatus Marinimicrobia bacterium]|nr:hypothetical protein [Candidatus Neomarinimicrobiota bacterium]
MIKQKNISAGRPTWATCAFLTSAWFYSCSLEVPTDLPSWTVTIDFPLTEESVTLESILDDSLIQKIPDDEGGAPILFAFRDTMDIDEKTFDDAVGVDPIEKLINSPLDTIKLSNIDPSKTDPFLFSEIYPAVSSVSGGNVIPSFALQPIAKSFTFDSFKSADFVGGTLSLTIANNMVIALGPPVIVDLQDANGTTLLTSAAKWEEEIGVNSSSTKEMDLTGVTLPGDIKILVTGTSSGSKGNTITIDSAARKSSFTVEISGQEPKVISALAKVPEQTIDEKGIIELDSGNRVERAKINEGTLEVAINNRLDLDADLYLEIASLQDNGSPFSTTISMPRKNEILSSYDLAGNWMVLDLALDPQEVNYSYQVVTEATESDVVEPYRSVESTDSITVRIDLYGSEAGDDLVFSEITGIIEAMEQPVDTIRQEITTLPEEFDGMDFTEVDMSMTFDTDIAIPVRLDLDIVASNIDTATTRIVRGWNITHPDSHTIIIPDAEALINIKPDSILAFGKAIVGGGEDVITFYGTETFKGKFLISIPFVFELTDAAVVELDAEKVEREFPEELEALKIFLDYDNQFDFGNDITLMVAEDTAYFESGSSVSPDILASVTLNPNSASLDSFVMSQDKIDLFKDDLYIKTKIEITGEEDADGNPVPVKFLSTESLSILFYGSIEYLVDPEDE